MTTLDHAFTPQIEIKRDGYGRYLLPHPVTGEERSWQRVTTFNKLLADSYNLERWRLRKAAQGLAARPDLLALVGSVTDPDSQDGKRTLGDAVDQAMEAAGSTSAANMGTALHALTEAVDYGHDLPPCTPELAARVQQYRDTLAAHGIETVPEWIERIIVNTRLDVGGTVDRFVRCADGAVRVLDLKTGSTVHFGQLEHAMQLAAYATADGLYNGHGFDPMPAGLDLTTGYIVHLPVDGDTCTIHEVDLLEGAAACGVATEVRHLRKSKPMRALPNPLDKRRQELLARCRSLDPERAAKARQAWPEGVGPITGPLTAGELDRVEAMLDVLNGPPISDDHVQALTARLEALPPDLFLWVEGEAKAVGVAHASRGWRQWEADTLATLLASAENTAAERYMQRIRSLAEFDEDGILLICEVAHASREAVGRSQLDDLGHERVMAVIELWDQFGTLAPGLDRVADHVGGKRPLISAAKAAAKRHGLTAGNSAAAVADDPVLCALAIHTNTNNESTHP